MNEIVLKEIRKEGSRYYVYSKAGKKLSKGYATRAEAAERLGQIEHFKRHKEDSRVEWPECFLGGDLNAEGDDGADVDDGDDRAD